MKQLTIAGERMLITVASVVYLLLFDQTVPHGDAMRIVRQIDAGQLIWNPNHLLFDPLGYWLFNLVRAYWPNVAALDLFEIISAISTVVSLFAFHAILVRLGITNAAARMLASLLLFGSAAFLSVAISQYYFMIQMPVLMAALYIYICAMADDQSTRARDMKMYAIGAILAVATAIMFNNLLLVLACGIGVAWSNASWRELEWRRAAQLYAGAALVGLPIFTVGHVLSGVDANLFQWVLAYEGNVESSLNEVYGAKWTVGELVRGMAMVGFKFTIGSLVNPAGLGTILAKVTFGGQLEFTPNWLRIAVGVAAIPVAITVSLRAAFYAVTRLKADPFIRFLSLWVGAYLCFNFLWNVGDEIFWFQILPIIWILFLMSLLCRRGAVLGTVTASGVGPDEEWPIIKLATVGALLIVVNTFNAVLPWADREYLDKQRVHADLLREGDLEIIPGWDQQKWMMLPPNAVKVDRLILVNLAIGSGGSAEKLEDLPEIVRTRLDSGGRVVVARLFDIDDDMMPWYSLQDRGWPRARLQSLLSEFCSRPLATIDGVVLREIVYCEH